MRIHWAPDRACCAALRPDCRERPRVSEVADDHLASVGIAYYLVGRPAEASAVLKQLLAHRPNTLGAHLILAAVYSELGQEAEARAEAAEALRLNPQLTVAMIAPAGSLNDKAHPIETERFRADLRKAGLK